MNELFVIVYIYIIEIRRSCRVVISILFMAAIVANAPARNKDYSIFAIWVAAIALILIMLALVVFIRYRYALKYWPDISMKINEARDIKGRLEVARYVSDRVDFKK